MKKMTHIAWLIPLIAGLRLGMATACAGVTNAVPWIDSFESYTVGTSLNGTNGWSSDAGNAGVVATDPLPSVTQSNVLKLTSQICNDIRSETGGVVTLDMVAMPTLLDTPPCTVDANAQYAFYIATNGHVMIWHRNTIGTPTNEWLELANAPVVTGVWTRFTVKQDYSNNLYQISLNSGAPLTHAAGWTSAGGSHPGSWFYMVQTNGLMARLRVGEDATNYVDDVSVDFGNPAVLVYGTTVYAETVTNNGTVYGTTLSLSNKLFAATNGEDMVLNGKVTYANLPAGLGLHVLRGATARDATLAFSEAATSHALSNSISNLTITFTDAAFQVGHAAAVANAALSNLQVLFADPRMLSYNSNAFIEQSGGVIDNRIPMTITLSGDTFAGADGQDFVALGWVMTNGIPAGLSAQITRSSATQLVVRLTGTAVNNTTNFNVYNGGFTFLDAAFTSGNAAFVGGYTNPLIQVLFTNDTGFFNVMPYAESFEGYANGVQMTGTNGWSAETAEAGVITDDPVQAAGVLAYLNPHRPEFPIVTNHTKVLALSDYVSCEVHSEGAQKVYLDLMGLPVPYEGQAMTNDASRQYAFYVNTNCQVVIWHQNRTGAPVNEWRVLTASQIDTSKWTRFTVVQDYASKRFAIMINETAPIIDAAGWNDADNGRPGPWFHMVQTNASMTRVKVGAGATYLDDLTVRTALPMMFAGGTGSIFVIR